MTAGSRGNAPQTAGHTIRWWAGWYDAVTWLLTFGQEPAIRRQTLKVAAIQPGEKVLDVGCGTGTLSLAAWRRVQPAGEVTGVDASPEMIQLARRKAKRNRADAQFHVALIEELPFPDGTFDAVLSSFMLHHLPDDVKEKGFQEIKRVLKPHGRFIAVDLADRGRSLVARLTGLFGHSMPDGYVQGLVSRMKAAGFQDAVEIESNFRYLAFLRGKA